MKLLKIAFIFLALQSFSQRGFAAKDVIQLTDSSRISLLSVSPCEDEVYTLFGHTAIRVEDAEINLDTVFNYGVFCFTDPNFILRFIQGQTDYMVNAVPFSRFIYDYSMRAGGVYEQQLNLSLADRQRVWEALLINIRPENMVYRYNFLFDNCATRARDIIENNIEGKISYTPTNEKKTFRDLIHECLAYNPWTKFGIDIIIGSGADTIITDRQKDFLPLYLSDAFRRAKLKYSGEDEMNLVPGSLTLIEPRIDPNQSEHPVNYPLIIGCALLVLTLAVSYLSYKKRQIVLGKIFDTVLFLVAGLAGCVVFFLWFFSEHPCVDANWNLVWLNPLYLIAACLFFVKPVQKYIYYYHFINFVALSLFVLAWYFVPQQLEAAFIPYILSLAIRSGMVYFTTKKVKAGL